MTDTGPDKFRVYFCVFNFGVPSERITSIMGVPPHQAWRKGDQGPRGSVRTHDRWELRGDRCLQDSFEEQLEELLSILGERREAVKELVSRYEVGICCTAQLRKEFNPSCHLSASIVKRLADLDLSIDFDLYMFQKSEVPG